VTAVSGDFPTNPYNRFAWILGEPEIGPGCWIGAFTVIDGSGGLRIGRGCEISSGAQIYTHTTVRRTVSDRQLQIERAPTIIGDHVHVGANAVILMGTRVGNSCVIGAGAVVRQFSELPDHSLAVGVPARIVDGGARRYFSPSAE
jgi:acetyltransferase-like isoleucine patch superfamily enzyme